MSIPRDKRLHFFAGFLITIFFSYFFSCLAGLLLGVLAGIGKEVYDWLINVYEVSQGRKEKHNSEFADFAATAIGAIVGYAVYGVAFLCIAT